MISNVELTSIEPVPSSAVPEPGTLFLLGAGLVGLGILGKKRKQFYNN
jgi:hypothetical protein